MRFSPIVIASALTFLTACPPPGSSGGAGGGANPSGQSRRGALAPPSCGAIDVNPVGRKIQAFLLASYELDKASFELEESVYAACRDMAVVLEVPVVGDTATLCNAVSLELDANLEVSVSQEQRLVTRTEPPVCTTTVDFAAEVAATCEARAEIDIDARCDGYCTGSCAGVCEGQCATVNADGSCAGVCNGQCRGRCTGQCRGSVNVDADAECKAAAEIRADVRTQCTEAKVVVVTENVTVVDSTKFDKATRAIEIGMPNILRAGAKAAIVAKSLVHWAKTAGELAVSGGKVIAAVGERSVCVGLELAAAVAASTHISARIDVSIEVSAKLSASAGTN